MASVNKKVIGEPLVTHGGTPGAPTSNLNLLRRSVLSCLLWEDEFYESGEQIAARIATLAQKCDYEDVLRLAVEARTSGLRHAPLWLIAAVAKSRRPADRFPKVKLAETLTRVCRRADDVLEFLSLYWKAGKQPLSAQVKKGLAGAMRKFSEYHFAKYNRKTEVKFRDVLRLVHPKPDTEEQGKLWGRVVAGTLQTPDTWEVQLSAGGDKKEVFTRLISENKLGVLALLRNLRNMRDARVDRQLIADALGRADVSKVFPYQFIAAARHAPEFEPALDQALLRGLQQAAKLPGRTVVIIDVSGSMYGAPVSAKSEMTRAHAACAIAAIARELCEDVVIYATAGCDYTRTHQTAVVPARRGMALVDAVYGLCRPLGGGGIFLAQVMSHVQSLENSADRTVVITDEQDCSGDAAATASVRPLGRGYMLNVASARTGIGYGPHWTHIDGFSHAVLDYIRAVESQT